MKFDSTKHIQERDRASKATRYPSIDDVYVREKAGCMEQLRQRWAEEEEAKKRGEL